jgi:hypothetical protein
MRIIAAFPGTGRRAYIHQYPNVGYVNPPLYPWNQPRHHAEIMLTRTIQRQASRGNYAMVTAHVRTLKELDKLQFGYVLVVPDVSLQMEYYLKLLDSAAPEGGQQFASYVQSTWAFWLEKLRKKAHPRVTITLQSGETIADRLPFHQNPDYFEGYKGIDNTDPCSVG